MRSSALILIALALTAVGASAAERSDRSKAGARGPYKWTRTIAAPACSLTTPVCELNGYDPSPPRQGETYNPPAICTTPDRDAGLVKAAFALASPNLQKEMCNLDAIFIVEPSPAAYSWGFWENPITRPTNTGDAPRRFVGIQRDVLQKPLSTLKNETLARVLRNIVPQNVRYLVTANDTREQSIASVLAHEIGHIKWHRENLYSTLRCYYQTFVFNRSSAPGNQERSWRNNDTLPKSVGRFFHPPPDDLAASGGAELARGLEKPHKPGGLTLGQLRGLYTGGFASAFAAISPEEDFVETYTLLALNQSGSPPTIEIDFPGSGRFPVSDTTNALVKEKLACVGQLPPPAVARR